MCDHDKYNKRPYMEVDDAWKAMKRSEIMKIGKIVQKCECGADISKGQRVKTWTYEEWL